MRFEAEPDFFVVDLDREVVRPLPFVDDFFFFSIAFFLVFAVVVGFLVVDDFFFVILDLAVLDLAVLDLAVLDLAVLDLAVLDLAVLDLAFAFLFGKRSLAVGAISKNSERVAGEKGALFNRVPN